MGLLCTRGVTLDKTGNLFDQAITNIMNRGTWIIWFIQLVAIFIYLKMFSFYIYTPSLIFYEYSRGLVKLEKMWVKYTPLKIISATHVWNGTLTSMTCLGIRYHLLMISPKWQNYISSTHLLMNIFLKFSANKFLSKKCGVTLYT